MLHLISSFLGKSASTGLRHARRVIVAVLGGTVLLIGIALLVLPGPAFVVIPLGLAILATEFVWARRWLRRAKRMIMNRVRNETGAGPKNESHSGRHKASNPASECGS